jgi:glycosyltransferase involved in cell wall biosynthesis
VVTAEAGSVVRDGIEGFVVAPRDIDALAERMEQLGKTPQLRARMSAAARERALEFDWPRYHEAVVTAVEAVAHECSYHDLTAAVVG